MSNQIYNNYRKKLAFKIICDKLIKESDLNEINSIKTKKGNTQNSERITIGNDKKYIR